MTVDKKAELRSALAAWQQTFRIDETPAITTDLDIEVKPVYTPQDLDDTDYLRDIGLPAQYPFTRGNYPQMYRHQPWRINMIAAWGGPEETKEKYRALAAAGQAGFSIVLDTPTHLGLDSDNPIAQPEVGRVGLAVDTVNDFEILFEGLPMERIPIAMNEETLAGILAAMYLVAARKRGIAWSDLQGTFSNDPLSSAVCKRTVVFPLEHACRVSLDFIAYSANNLPKFRPIQLKGVNLREGYADMAQEMGFLFANGIYYIEQLVARGMDVDEFAPMISFFCSNTHHIFEEAAKYRAARRLWARILKQRFGAQKQASMSFRLTAMTNPVEYQKEQAELNIVRGAYGALAAALGGCQGMLNPSFDEVYDIPSERGHLIALGTCQVLAEETGVRNTVDPLGGSYYVETLTNRLEAEIEQKMEDVAKRGGPIAALESGWEQQAIYRTMDKYLDDVESGKITYVGRNKYVVGSNEQVAYGLHHPDPEAPARQIARLKKIKEERDNGQVSRCLERLKLAATGSENLMPYFMEAAEAYATLGEMVGVLKSIWGAYEEPHIQL